MTRAGRTKDQRLSEALQTLARIDAGEVQSNQETEWKARLQEKVAKLEEQGAKPTTSYWPMGIRGPGEAA
jgi:hypothetical protein